MSFTENDVCRLEQIAAISTADFSGEAVLIHGSVGHSAFMGYSLPTETRRNGTSRDVDVYARGQSKTSLELEAEVAGLALPQPIDAGLCNLLIKIDGEFAVQKDGLTMGLEDCGVFDEIESYELVGSGGVQVRSFGPTGIKAAHLLEPRIVRPGKLKIDWELTNWFKKNNIDLPDKLQASIDEFHRAYKEKYPLGNVYRQLADIYTSALPENVRSRFKKHTHRFMRDHAGRVSPFLD